jgi:hypothetical protein
MSRLSRKSGLKRAVRIGCLRSVASSSPTGIACVQSVAKAFVELSALGFAAVRLAVICLVLVRSDLSIVFFGVGVAMILICSVG